MEQLSLWGRGTGRHVVALPASLVQQLTAPGGRYNFQQVESLPNPLATMGVVDDILIPGIFEGRLALATVALRQGSMTYHASNPR